MKYWFIPTWSGDFRLAEHKTDKNKTVLDVENPTLHELEQLKAFLRKAVLFNWVAEDTVIKEKGKTQIVLATSVVSAAPELVIECLPETKVWTGVRSERGALTLYDGKDLPEPVKETAEAAVTTRPPSRGCPVPESCERRASEVLRCFSTERQWREFDRTGSMPVIGNYTGQTYRLFHRDEAASHSHTRCLIDATGLPICVWNDTVPPEEEMLSIKLAVEHREAWLRGLARGTA